jgi:hypothetical protein
MELDLVKKRGPDECVVYAPGDLQVPGQMCDRCNGRMKLDHEEKTRKA